MDLHITMASIQLHHVHHSRVVVLYPKITRIALVLVKYRVKNELHLSNRHIDTAQASPGGTQFEKLVKPVRIPSRRRAFARCLRSACLVLSRSLGNTCIK